VNYQKTALCSLGRARVRDKKKVGGNLRRSERGGKSLGTLEDRSELQGMENPGNHSHETRKYKRTLITKKEREGQ